MQLYEHSLKVCSGTLTFIMGLMNCVQSIIMFSGLFKRNFFPPCVYMWYVILLQWNVLFKRPKRQCRLIQHKWDQEKTCTFTHVHVPNEAQLQSITIPMPNTCHFLHICVCNLGLFYNVIIYSSISCIWFHIRILAR